VNNKTIVLGGIQRGGEVRFKTLQQSQQENASSDASSVIVDEFQWRFNQRDNPYLVRDALMRLLNSPKMEFKELIEISA
jgi:hypothetical protein